MKLYSTVAARENFSGMINESAYGNEPVILSRRGKPLVAVISYKQFQEWEAYKAQQALEVNNG